MFVTTTTHTNSDQNIVLWSVTLMIVTRWAVKAQTEASGVRIVDHLKIKRLFFWTFLYSKRQTVNNEAR